MNEHRDELAALMRERPGGNTETVFDVFVSYLRQRPAWMAEAACAGLGGEVEFFPGQGGDVRPAKAVCGTCPVRVPCLNYATRDQLIVGIWGGASDRQRRAIHSMGRRQDPAA